MCTRECVHARVCACASVCLQKCIMAVKRGVETATRHMAEPVEEDTDAADAEAFLAQLKAVVHVRQACGACVRMCVWHAVRAGRGFLHTFRRGRAG
ncbi:hypothetical protein EON67_03625 [archaeon]|nr:MAG: hypothetical protein EON67_03625 [archaeon]